MSQARPLRLHSETVLGSHRREIATDKHGRKLRAAGAHHREEALLENGAASREGAELHYNGQKALIYSFSLS